MCKTEELYFRQNASLYRVFFPIFRRRSSGVLFEYLGKVTQRRKTKGDLLGLAHPFQLPVLLHRPEAINGSVVRHQPGSQLGLKPFELPGGEVFLFISQGGDAEILDGLIDEGGIAPVPVGLP